VPRNNRRDGRRRDEGEPLDVDRLRAGFRRTETKRGESYTVQPISERRCNLSIAEGVAHLVAWRNDGIMGESQGLSDRRHWHNHCWKIG
jgi:hypothetical protein